MKNFYLFRHGLATKSLIGYGDKILTATLLPEGVPPIERMAEFLKDIPSDFNVSSEFLRCQQTTKIISDITNKKFVRDVRLNEYYNESFEEFRTRVKNFLQEIETQPYKNIIICTHGAVVAALKNLITKNSFYIFQQFTFPKTGVLMIIKNNTIEEIDFNL